MPKADPHLGIAHVLFIDVVGYSKLLVNEQREVVEQLNRIVRRTPQFRKSEAAGKLIRIPVGDGMALVFFDTPEEPVQCAMEIARALRNHRHIRLRMGVHSGPVDQVRDVNDRSNVAGVGINIAQRVMDCGDSGHILLSKRVAEDLAQDRLWQPHLHELGEVELKHGVRIGIVNLYTAELGNPQLPQRLKASRQKQAARVTPRDVFFGRKTALVAAVVLLAASFGIGLWKSRHSVPPKLTSIAAPLPEKSIAVLPFENLSADPENAYFAGGIQDDILTNLAKIGDLKVISRTSVAKYKSNAQSAREIGSALGVATVLEGSVRRAGNRVRVNVQLIDTSNDSHIWAEDFDRELTDVFAIQSDLALQIASVLQTKLSPTEKARLQRKPTENGTAYLLYLQALDSFRRAQGDEDWRRVEAAFEKALEADPSFALALARLSYVETLLYINGDRLPGRLEKARATADEALRLQPDLPEAHLALGQVYLRERDYEHALAELTIAKAGLPNDPRIFLGLGSIERRQGKWSQATADFRRAAELDPKDAFNWMMLALNYEALRQFPAAADAIDQGCAADPTYFAAKVARAELYLDWKGELNPLDQLLSGTPGTVDPNGIATLFRFRLKLFQRKYDEAIDLLNKSALDRLIGMRANGPYPKPFLLAELYLLLRDKKNAAAAYEQARAILEETIRENPNDAAKHALLGRAYAGLGRREDAIREGKRATELLPESKDAFDGPLMTLGLAQIYTRVGDFDLALPLLEHSLSSPAGVTPALLRLDPAWDALRQDPRFEKLLAKFEASSPKS